MKDILLQHFACAEGSDESQWTDASDDESGLDDDEDDDEAKADDTEAAGPDDDEHAPVNGSSVIESEQPESDIERID